MDLEQRDRIVATGLVLAAFVVAVGASITVLNASHYRTFHIEGDLSTEDFCKVYDASCTCYGTLRIMESYPPQYACDGIEICHDMDRRVCP